MEHWEKTYTSDVDIYEAFCAAFDPESTVWHRGLVTSRSPDDLAAFIRAMLALFSEATMAAPANSATRGRGREA